MKSLEGRFAAAQEQGGRDYQEDDYGALDGRDLGIDGSEHTLLVLSDGMGGHAGGATASNVVVKTLIEGYPDLRGPVSDRLRELVQQANENIALTVQESPALEGMGATLIAVVISKRGVEWISLGDSPMWLFQGDKLVRLNADHSMMPVFDELVAMEQMSREEADNDPKRHTLRSAIIGEELHLVDVSSQPRTVRGDDILLLASDGINTLSDEEIYQILNAKQHQTLEEKSQALIQAVMEKNEEDQDNVTLILYQSAGNNSGGDTAPAASARQVEKGTENRPSQIYTWLPWVISALLLLVLTFVFVGPEVDRDLQVKPAPEIGQVETSPQDGQKQKGIEPPDPDVIGEGSIEDKPGKATPAYDEPSAPKPDGIGEGTIGGKPEKATPAAAEPSAPKPDGIGEGTIGGKPEKATPAAAELPTPKPDITGEGLIEDKPEKPTPTDAEPSAPISDGIGEGLIEDKPKKATPAAAELPAPKPDITGEGLIEDKPEKPTPTDAEPATPTETGILTISEQDADVTGLISEDSSSSKEKDMTGNQHMTTPGVEPQEVIKQLENVDLK